MRTKFINKVLEIVNKKQKVDFVNVIDEKIPKNMFVVEGKIYGQNYIHTFTLDIKEITYKLIKEYAIVLQEIIKLDKIQLAKSK